MKATTIRYNAKNGGGIPTLRILEGVCEELLGRLSRVGFITEATVATSTSIKIGLHMSSFRINTEKLGHNARLGMSAYGWNGASSPKGYKRTNVPTWDQRVMFNDIVNDVFDSNHLVCTIRSGAYVVRTRDGRRHEHDWFHEGHNGGWSSDACREIVTEKEARKQLDSDRLEAEHKAKTRPERLAKARARRALMKQFKAAKRVKVAGDYNGKLNGLVVTHARFERLLAKASSWNARRMKEASITATINQGAK